MSGERGESPLIQIITIDGSASSVVNLSEYVGR